VRAERVAAEDLEPVGGAVPLDSPYYVERGADREFQAALARRDSIVLVKGARQVGKTSLLARSLHAARQAGSRVALTDFQLLNAAQLETPEALLRALARALIEQLGPDVRLSEQWDPEDGPNYNFRRLVRRIAACEDTAVVWGLDEVDRLFTCPFGGEIFGMFRAWHNERAFEPDGPWGRVTLAIAYATEAHLFITDLNQSPFNVGTRLSLEDFTEEQVADLNGRYGAPLRSEGELACFYSLVGGHPYLVRRGLHELAAGGLNLAQLTAQAERDEGIYGDHLRRMLLLLGRDEILTAALRDVLQGRPCPDLASFYRLRSAGVLSGDTAADARPRCALYASFLRRHLL
jgi:hypothetical protein